MKTYNIDTALVEQVIQGIEDLLNISDDNTPGAIQKLTALLNKAEQQKLIDDWATLYFFDCDPELLTNEHLIKYFFLDKLK